MLSLCFKNVNLCLEMFVRLSDYILRAVTTISSPVVRLLKQASDGLQLLEGSVISPHIMPVQHNTESHCLFISSKTASADDIVLSTHHILLYQHGAPPHTQYHIRHLTD